MKRKIAIGFFVLCLGITVLIFNYSDDKVYASEDIKTQNNEIQEKVELKDLVIKFIGIPEFEPNRYTKVGTGKMAPEEMEKGLHLKVSMKKGAGNPDGMMAPLKFSLADITAEEKSDQKTGKIVITYNGLTLTMTEHKREATLDDGKTVKTLIMDSDVTPYFYAVPDEKNSDGSQYYATYLPVKFTATALGGSVVWNEAMHRLEMGFAFYYSDAAVTPVVNSKSDYTTQQIEKDKYKYAELKKRITSETGVANMIQAGLNVVNPVYQNQDGGWGKTNTEYDLLHADFVKLLGHAYSTFDNGSTHGHLKFLSRIIKLSKANPSVFTAYALELKTIEEGFWKGVKYLIDAQNDLGGWPQYYPYGVGYFKNITFNNNAMPNVMQVIFALESDDGLIDDSISVDFDWAREAIRLQENPLLTTYKISEQSLDDVWQKAIKFTLDAQVKVDGVLTGWAQQYDPETGKPALGRAFELASVSPSESQQVIKVLANIKNPSTQVKQAIESYVTWINSVGFTGYSVYTINDRTRELAKDKLLVKDGSTSKLFGRFYGLDTTGDYYGLKIENKITDSPYYEIFSGRDSVARFDLNDGMSERRSNYSFVGGGRDKDANDLLNKWKGALELEN